MAMHLSRPLFLPRRTAVGRVATQWTKIGEIRQWNNRWLERPLRPLKRLAVKIGLSKHGSITA
jgi:hypothetical protein